MPSNALHRWQTERKQALDEIQSAHHAVGGHGRGRRYATLQINHAYAVLLSSHFQGYCRDLHSEAVGHMARQLAQATLGQVFRASLTLGRKLDQGNPNPGNLGADFSRLGLAFWPQVETLDKRNTERQRLLSELCEWRNAVAHQDFSKIGGKPDLALAKVRAWRASLDALAKAFDRTVEVHLTGLAGSAPW